MTEELTFDQEIRFKFKEGSALNDLVLAFCEHFEEENQGHWSYVKKADLIPEKLIVVLASRTWLIGGEGIALLLFYSDDNDVGGVATYIYNVGATYNRPISKLKEQFGRFFEERCNELIQLESQSGAEEQEEGRSSDQEAATRERQPQAWLTPIRFCEKCSAAIAIDESTYCWNCGAELPRGISMAVTQGQEGSGIRPHCDEVEYDRSCMICRLAFKDGDLLAWCPNCGAPAHRVHMLEWLHVKGTCPACGQHLATPELEEQLSQAHLQRESKASGQSGKRNEKPAKR
jgi:predicted RNA-binding Zn-ribbon protein involved in translation (DUF1610 family)